MQPTSIDRPKGNPSAEPHALYESNQNGPWPKWFAGLAVPAVLSIYGLAFIITQQATIFGRNVSMQVYDGDAVALGICCLAAAGFLHSHFFWTRTKLMARWSTAIMTLSGLTFVASAVYLLISVAVYG